MSPDFAINMTVHYPTAFRLIYVVIVHESSSLVIFHLSSLLCCPLLGLFLPVILLRLPALCNVVQLVQCKCVLTVSICAVVYTFHQFSLFSSVRYYAIYLPLFCLQKGTAVPLQACSGPEVSRKLRFSDFMTTAQDGGKVVSFTHRPPLPRGNTSGYSILLEAESTPWP